MDTILEKLQNLEVTNNQNNVDDDIIYIRKQYDDENSKTKDHETEKIVQNRLKSAIEIIEKRHKMEITKIIQKFEDKIEEIEKIQRILLSNITIIDTSYCNKCRRSGHTVQKCYARVLTKTDITNKPN